MNFNETISLHRPAWTSEAHTGNLEAFNHLHLSAHQDGQIISPIRHNHFLRTGGFATMQDRREWE